MEVGGVQANTGDHVYTEPVQCNGIRPCMNRKQYSCDHLRIVFVVHILGFFIEIRALKISENVLAGEERMIGRAPAGFTLRYPFMPQPSRQIVSPGKTRSRQDINLMPAMMMDKPFNQCLVGQT